MGRSMLGAIGAPTGQIRSGTEPIDAISRVGATNRAGTGPKRTMSAHIVPALDRATGAKPGGPEIGCAAPSWTRVSPGPA